MIIVVQEDGTTGHGIGACGSLPNHDTTLAVDRSTGLSKGSPRTVVTNPKTISGTCKARTQIQCSTAHVIRPDIVSANKSAFGYVNRPVALIKLACSSIPNGKLPRYADRPAAHMIGT